MKPSFKIIVTYRCYSCGELVQNMDGTTPDISEGRQLFVSEDYAGTMPPKPLPKDTTVHHIEHLLEVASNG